MMAGRLELNTTSFAHVNRVLAVLYPCMYGFPIYGPYREGIN